MNNYCGIILAGGSGTRLFPVTKSVSKQLLPIYNKPMIYYPLSTLMLAGIRDILVITTPQDQQAFQNLLEDGSQFGIKISYAMQPSPDGLAQAFIIGEEFMAGRPVAMVLGDNLFYGHGLPETMARASARTKGATIFAYHVKDPERYGVATFGKDGKVTELVEKPTKPTSSFAITGLYFYDNKVCEYAKTLKPSPRGELEITDLNKVYVERGELSLEVLGRGFAWLDTGTFESYLQACNYIQTLEERQGSMISCPEEIAYFMKYINTEQLLECANKLKKNSYGQYLLNILTQENALS